MSVLQFSRSSSLQNAGGEETSSLDRLYDALTTAMRKRAINLGMVVDWDAAESVSKVIDSDQEVLDPLLQMPRGLS